MKFSLAKKSIDRLFGENFSPWLIFLVSIRNTIDNERLAREKLISFLPSLIFYETFHIHLVIIFQDCQFWFSKLSKYYSVVVNYSSKLSDNPEYVLLYFQNWINEYFISMNNNDVGYI